jgi:hypothetical protein
MPGFGRLDWSNWLYALFSALISGGAAGVVGSVGVSALDPERFAIGSTRFFAMAGMLFTTHAFVAFFNFLKQHPLPTEITTVTTVQTVRGNGATTTTVAHTETIPAPQEPKE